MAPLKESLGMDPLAVVPFVGAEELLLSQTVNMLIKRNQFNYIVCAPKTSL